MRSRIAVGALILAGMAAAGLASCAPASPPPGSSGPPGSMSGPALPASQCFFTDDIRSHTIADDRTLYVKLRQEQVYRVTMSNRCLAASLPLDALIMRLHGTTRVCRPIDLDVSVRGGSRCIVESITPLTPAEVQQIPENVRP